MKKQLTCINCPLGCTVTVSLEGEQIVDITGNTCKRGEVYARNELKNPVRVVTSTVRMDGGEDYLVSVKTKEPIPKGKIREVMQEINRLSVKSPVKVGDLVTDNICGTGVSLIVTSAGR